MTEEKQESPTFETNAAAFAAAKADLLKTHLGKFALFHNNAFVDAFDTMEAAHDRALRDFPFDPIFIGHAVVDDPPSTIPALVTGLIDVGS